jgi:uncharacterized protein (DUF1684 family)
MNNADYTQETEAWRQKLDQALRAENGWLALAGLYWLEPGQNSFGSGDSNIIQLPRPNLPERVGSFVLGEDSVSLIVIDPGDLRVNDLPASEMTLKPDLSGEPDVLTLGSLTLMVIKRGEQTGIRLWDNDRPERVEFGGRSWFRIKPEYRIEAALSRYDPPRDIQILNTVGVSQDVKVVGRVEFNIAGKSCSLEAFEGGEESVSFILKDASAIDQTYPAGRFLVAPLLDGDRVVLDFNRAYNPPCAVSGYTTCPLPPPENILEVRIEAGERYLGHSAVS